MICKYCNTEHPSDQIANPHYCIARLGEQIDALEAEVKEKEEQINDTYGLMIFLAQIGKAEMKRKREEREQ